MAVVETSTLPTVTPPWLRQAQQSPQQQAPQQNPAPQQQQQQQFKQPKFNYTKAASKLFQKPITNAVKSYFGAGGAATGIGGASGALTAGGGSFVTGSGLAGTASAINTTAGAAGTSGGFSGGFSGLKGGLASAGVGILGGFLGGKLFKSEESAIGAGAGASIGFSVGGPIGAAAGFVFGGIGGKLFGSDKKEPFARFMQGAGLTKYDGRGPGFKNLQTTNTALGRFGFAGTELDRGVTNKIMGAVKQSDEAVAKLFDNDQLSRAKQGISWFDTKGVGSKLKGDRLKNTMSQFFKDRYSNAVGGLDLDYKDTFSRVADDKNMGGLVSTFAQLDKDVRNGTGIFQDFKKNTFDPASINPNDIRLQKTIQAPNPKAGQGTYWSLGGYWPSRPEPKTIPVANPKYDAALADQYESRKVASGYKFSKWKTTSGPFSFGPQPEYEKQTAFGQRIGDDALNHIAQKYEIGGRPSKGQLKTVPKLQRSPFSGGAMNGSDVQLAKQHNNRVEANYQKSLGAWEKKVLDAYVNNYQQGLQMQRGAMITESAKNIAGAGITRSNQAQSVKAQGTASSTRTRLFGNVKQQSVKLNRATQRNDQSTNAGGLLQQSEVM